MPLSNLIWSLLGILAGAAVAVQTPVNAALGRGLGVPTVAAGFSFVSGAVLLGIVSLGLIWLQGASVDLKAPAPWLFVTGGALGAIFVTAAIVLTPKLGAAALTALALAGQLSVSMLLDRIGFLGMAVREISVGRVTGAVLLLAGALMIRIF